MYRKKVWKFRIMVVLVAIVLVLTALWYSFGESSSYGAVFALLWIGCIYGVIRKVEKVKKRRDYC